MLETPDGHGRVELSSFDSPPSPDGAPPAPANVPGLHHLSSTVDDVDDVVDHLRGHGVELVGEVVRYEDLYRLCYVRGPAGIIVELAQPLR